MFYDWYHLMEMAKRSKYRRKGQPCAANILKVHCAFIQILQGHLEMLFFVLTSICNVAFLCNVAGTVKWTQTKYCGSVLRISTTSWVG